MVHAARMAGPALAQARRRAAPLRSPAMSKTRTLLLLVLPALALALLGAHFLRVDQFLGVAACALGLALLWLAPSRLWVRRLLQLALLAGAAEWAWAALLLVQQRQALGQPWQRMAAILALVALATLAAIGTLGRLRRGR
jgi:hypothetical protein